MWNECAHKAIVVTPQMDGKIIFCQWCGEVFRAKFYPVMYDMNYTVLERTVADYPLSYVTKN